MIIMVEVPNFFPHLSQVSFVQNWKYDSPGFICYLMARLFLSDSILEINSEYSSMWPSYGESDLTFCLTISYYVSVFTNLLRSIAGSAPWWIYLYFWNFSALYIIPRADCLCSCISFMMLLNFLIWTLDEFIAFYMSKLINFPGVAMAV